MTATKMRRKRAALRIALKSDNPAVQSALDQLLVATELAHAEEISDSLKPKELTPAAQFVKSVMRFRKKQRADDWSTGI